MLVAQLVVITWLSVTAFVRLAGLDEVRQLGSMAAAAASAADVAGRPAAALQLHAVSAACLGISLDSAELAGNLLVGCSWDHRLYLYIPC